MFLYATVAWRHEHDRAPQPPSIRPFRVDVPQADLDDLTRPPRAHPPAPARAGRRLGLGHPNSYLRDAVEQWRDALRLARRPRRASTPFPQFTTEIDGQTIHFIHVRSPHAGATPLILAHTYPGSFVDYLDMIEPLVDPVALGGRAEDAFDVVVPDAPGFGFSEPGRRAGLDDGARRTRLRHAHAPARLRLVRHPRQRQRRAGRPRARTARPGGLPRPARAAALLVPVGRPGASSRSSSRRTTRASSTCSGSSRSAATTR